MSSMENKKPAFKRRQFLINKEFQFKFALCFLIPGLVVTLLSSVLIWYLSAGELEKFIYRTHLTKISPLEVILPVTLKSIAVALIVFIAATYLITHFLFKKISDRLKAFDNAVLQIGKGDLNIEVPMASLKEVHGAFNVILVLIENMRDDLSALRTMHRDISSLIEKAEKEQDNEETMKRIGELSKEFEKRLSTARLTLE